MDHVLRTMSTEEVSANLFENLGSLSPPFSLETLESPTFPLETLESPTFPLETLESSGRDSGLGIERGYNFDEEKSPLDGTFPVSLNSIKKEVDPDESGNLLEDLHQEMEIAPTLFLGSTEPDQDVIMVPINYNYRNFPQTSRRRKQRMENLLRAGESSTTIGDPSSTQDELICSNSRKGKEKPLYLKTREECTDMEWRKAKRARNTKLFHERKNKKVRVANEAFAYFLQDYPHIFVELKQKDPELHAALQECFHPFMSK